MAAPAPNLVNLESVSKSFGTRKLLDGVSIGIGRGERAGVVGRNGDGKSTLLRVLSRLEPADAGRVTHNRDLRIGVLGQGDELDPDATVGRAVLGDAATHTWASDPRTRAVMQHLLARVDLEATIGTLSGGERRRASLARLLLKDLDLLVLDEPTNHLDIEAVAWLAAHVVDHASALVVVTHDRWFLDAVCTTTWEVYDGNVTTYDGGYAAYVLARAERTRTAAATEAKRQNLIRKELAWLRRGAPARTSKPKFRLDAATALIENEPPPRDRLELERLATSRLGKDVFDVEDVTLALGGRTLLDRVTFRLGPGDRIGLLGPNGAGKTTFLRVLTRELAPDQGRVKQGKTVRTAWLSQSLEDLEPGITVLEYVTEVRRTAELAGRGGELSATALLERFGFTRDRLVTRIGDLSGGERRRLQLLRILLDQPNVLILDEPTNDLDVETLTVLEDFLDAWPGTLVVVTHDRYFLERVTDLVYAVRGDGTVRHLPGGVDQYLVELGEAPAPEPRTTPEPAVSDAAALRAAKKDLARIERQLARLGDAEQKLHEAIAANATDYAKLTELDAELRGLGDERAELEAAWFEAAERAE